MYKSRLKSKPFQKELNQITFSNTNIIILYISVAAFVSCYLNLRKRVTFFLSDKEMKRAVD